MKKAGTSSALKLEDLSALSSTWYQETRRPRVFGMRNQRFTVEQMILLNGKGEPDGFCYVLENSRFKIDVIEQSTLDFFDVRRKKALNIKELSDPQKHAFRLG